MTQIVAFLVRFFIPTLLGNIIGGVAFVAVITTPRLALTIIVDSIIGVPLDEGMPISGVFVLQQFLQDIPPFAT